MEVAGMMYGVSMGKDGTTKVLGQRLEQPDPGSQTSAGPIEVGESSDRTSTVPEESPVH
jgi:hypothetical protein